MLELGFCLYVGGLIMLCLSLNNILSMLLSLEYMMLSLFMLLFMMLTLMNFEFIVYFLVMSVCEASLGLGLLVMGFMKGGNMKYKAISLLQW